MTQKSEALTSPNLFYVLVSLGLPGELPEFHIVPSAVVAATIKKSHAKWLASPGKSGRKRKDSSLRTFFDAKAKYLDGWATLGLKMID